MGRRAAKPGRLSRPSAAQTLLGGNPHNVRAEGAASPPPGTHPADLYERYPPKAGLPREASRRRTNWLKASFSVRRSPPSSRKGAGGMGRKVPSVNTNGSSPSIFREHKLPARLLRSGGCGFAAPSASRKSRDPCGSLSHARVTRRRTPARSAAQPILLATISQGYRFHG